MRQRYDNAAKFVTLGYPKPFTEHILEYPDLIVIEELSTEQITLKTHHTDSTLKVQFLVPEGIMQESPFFQEYVQEAEARGLERGQKVGTINSILTLLSDQFQSEAVQALKPRLETVEDLERLKELLRAAHRAQSLEAFMQNLQNS